MSEPRFTTLTPATMTADQKRVADAIQSGPRGAGLRGPRVNDTFGERGVVDLVGIMGYYALISMTLNVFEVPVPEGAKRPLGE